MTEKFVTKYDSKKLERLPLIDVNDPSKKYDQKEEKFLRELIVCEFSNLEQAGLMQEFTYGSTKNNMHFSFFHGGTYEIPRYLMKHVNQSGTPMYKYVPDGEGQTVKQYTGRKNRFSMQQVY